MSHSLRSCLFIVLFLFSGCIGLVDRISAAGFANPVSKIPYAGCQADNLSFDHFTAEVSADDRIKLCLAINKITNKLNSAAWSPSLSTELSGIWNVFSSQAVTVRLMPKGTSSRILAMAEPLAAGNGGARFQANIYLRPEKSDDASFFQVLLHELRHVYDFYETWKSKTKMNSLDLERRAFFLMSRLSEEAPETSGTGVPKFWKKSWASLPVAQSLVKRQSAIEDYLQKNKFYNDMGSDPGKQALDFTYLQKTTKATNAGDKLAAKAGERLPSAAPLPETKSLIPQNVKETDFSLDKPKNIRDPKEILRVALSNETKLYYGMTNFVYDQKLAFQCWNNGKVAARFTEDGTVARTANGDTLINSPSGAQPLPPCLVNYQNLKTDFTETFWASPALEKMPINFAGFVDVDGKTLARYTVLQPDNKLFNQMAAQFSFIKPFRVFVGTIFVSPEDGQIVKFWGTSYPDDKLTNTSSPKVFGSYLVSAVRQKLNIDKGLWVTVFISSTAAANVDDKLKPFSYTVKFENYRQSTTDVKILDDDKAVAVN